jgi:Sugar phosphate isomerases/epimerases
MGLCLDTGHLSIGGSDPVEIAEIAGPRVNHVHLKDVDLGLAARLAARELGFREAARKNAFRPLGEGDVDVGGVLERLEGSGYAGCTCWSRTRWSRGSRPRARDPWPRCARASTTCGSGWSRATGRRTAVVWEREKANRRREGCG